MRRGSAMRADSTDIAMNTRNKHQLWVFIVLWRRAANAVLRRTSTWGSFYAAHFLHDATLRALRDCALHQHSRNHPEPPGTTHRIAVRISRNVNNLLVLLYCTVMYCTTCALFSYWRPEQDPVQYCNAARCFPEISFLTL